MDVIGGILVFWVVLMSGVKSEEASCDFPAIFNFGDSNSDTGCMAAAFYPMASPCGNTFFHEPAGRASDGRLIIDFIAQKLGFPLLSPYIDSIGSSYGHGANFAAGSSTIRRQNRTFFDGGTPFTLEIQTAQFHQFKARTAKFFNQSGNNHPCRKQFPRPEDFPKAIYVAILNQNDIAAAIDRVGKEDSHAVISDIVHQFSTQVQYLYKEGARTFWIHNTGPIGCLPVAIHSTHNPKPGYVDQNGCVNYQNDMAKEFNEKLNNTVVTLRSQLPDASLTYVDLFSAKYYLISNAKKEGFVDPAKFCCGYHENGIDIWCGNKGTVNGTEIFAGSCEDPSSYISWDGVHYTEAANHWIADRIINGSFSVPPIAITHSCHKPGSLRF
ncbi:hypothetical protein K1719_045908 [Acacia pycnantha]|nr:hypothetical protein K1719_045908 [Acacia pycnantha]